MIFSFVEEEFHIWMEVSLSCKRNFLHGRKFLFSGRETCRKDGSFFLAEEKFPEKKRVSILRKRN